MANAYRLTTLEQEALWFVRLGLKNGTIASQMGVSVDTARLHIRNVHRKTGTADKLDLALKGWNFCVKHLRGSISKKRKTYRKR